MADIECIMVFVIHKKTGIQSVFIEKGILYLKYSGDIL